MSRVPQLAIVLLVLFSACKAPSNWMRPSATPASSIAAPTTNSNQANRTPAKEDQVVANSVDQQTLETTLADRSVESQVNALNTEPTVAASIQPSQQPKTVDSDLSNSEPLIPILSTTENIEKSIQVDATQPKTMTNIETASSPSVSNQETTVRLTLVGVRPELGPVKVAIYTDKQSFTAMKNASQSLQLPSNQSTLEFRQPMSGRFAAAVYQDINGDGELNRNRFGIPTEPFAFSNNAMGVRGPPSFEQAAVAVPDECDGALEVSIRLP